jgi:hypothetical protein
MARRKADREATMQAQQAQPTPPPVHADPEPEHRPPGGPVVPQDMPFPVVERGAPAAAIRVRNTGKPADPDDPPPWM